jgi:UDP-N-acetylmuramoyl-tripeptide--D-alanyl-D-alanine ligase
VPHTLLRLQPEHRVAVVEMAMSGAGEIALLAAIARPEAAIVTGAGAAHLGGPGLGTLEAIAREKASIALALPAAAPVFAAADSPRLLEALRPLGRRVVTYGLSREADVHPRSWELLGEEGARLEVDGFPPIRLPLVGRHNLTNALAAVAVAREYRLDPAAVADALSRVPSLPKRMEVRHARGATLLVDCYNSNPDSARAALETLAQWPQAERRIAVLGDMLELGPEAGALHEQVGAAAAGAELWLVGTHARDYARGAERAGVTARIFGGKPEVAAALASALSPGTVALLKASRGVALEDVLQGLEG